MSTLRQVRRFRPRALSILAAFTFLCLGGRAAATTAFAIHGPGVNPADFRVTVFASGLSFPLGMLRLSDGSMLVAVTQGTSFWNGNSGQIVRLTDANQDGIADGPGTVLISGLTSGLTSLRGFGHLYFVTGQGPTRPIYVLRAGPTLASPLTNLGTINFTYPSSWEHPHSALGIRPTPGRSGSCDLLFQVGSDQNFAKTTRTVTLSSAQITGASGTMEGESIYMLTLTDNLTNVVASNLTRLCKGLRNPAGFAFHPVTGDLYFEDNGIDGVVNANEPTSADEVNVIPLAQIGVTLPDFGFPTNYTEYRTGRLVGGGGVQPIFAFQPLPNPFTGSESEGPNDLVFAPAGFPPAFNNGLFVGFHGKWALGGINNEENPLVFADLTTTNYFHFVSNDEAGVGHFDGLLSTDDSLFLSDLTSTGNTDLSSNAGVIYQIKSLVAHVLSCHPSNNTLQFIWSRGGVLEQAADLAGPWTPISSGTNAMGVTVDPAQPQFFYRVQY